MRVVLMFELFLALSTPYAVGLFRARCIVIIFVILLLEVGERKRRLVASAPVILELARAPAALELGFAGIAC